jgi:plasmid stabilization system protein ParE
MAGKRFPLTSATRQDIRDALAFTKKRFGDAKAQDYASLIRMALHTITSDAHAGKPRPEIDPDAFAYPIARPGRNARHLFLYEIVDDQARIYGLFYDGMDLPVHWKGRREGTAVEDE